MELARLTGDELKQRLAQAGEWKFQSLNVPDAPQGQAMESLIKIFSFSNYQEIRKFVNQVGDIAEELKHYPSITFSGKGCNVLLWTEDLGGLTEKDFKLAEKIDMLQAPFTPI